MLTPRETAQTICSSCGNMPARVFGLDQAQLADLRAQRIERLEQALRSLRAAQGTPRLLVQEWSDDELEAAAIRAERQLQRERG